MALGFNTEGLGGWWGSSSTYDVDAPADDTTAGQTAGTMTSNDAWGGFWNIAETVARYGIAKDAAKTQQAGVYMPAQYTGQPVQRRDDAGGLLTLIIIGGILYAVAK